MDKNRNLAIARQCNLIIIPKILTELDIGTVFVKKFNRLCISKPLERRLDLLQRLDISLKNLQFFSASLKTSFNYKNNHILLHFEVIFMLNISRLRIHHPELRKMPLGLAFFRPENRSEIKSSTNRHHSRLQI